MADEWQDNGPSSASRGPGKNMICLTRSTGSIIGASRCGGLQARVYSRSAVAFRAFLLRLDFSISAYCRVQLVADPELGGLVFSAVISLSRSLFSHAGQSLNSAIYTPRRRAEQLWQDCRTAPAAARGAGGFTGRQHAGG